MIKNSELSEVMGYYIFFRHKETIIINGIATGKSVAQINETLYELNENTINQ